MSLYEVVHGRNPAWAELLRVAGFEYEPPRFRDAWVEVEGGRVIAAVHVRTGGPNRADYAGWWSEVREMPRYVSDEDEAYDVTYATLHLDLSRGLTEAYVEHFTELAADAPEGGYSSSLLGPVYRGRRDMTAEWQRQLERLPERLLDPSDPVHRMGQSMKEQFADAPPTGTMFYLDGDGTLRT
jgi:hypothetical protein